jgi:predicted NBD/HSP70 family sugar kinase
MPRRAADSEVATSSKDRGRATLPTHGAAVLPSVRVDSYNLEIEDEEGFVGDKASKGAFSAILSRWRDVLREVGDDPFGDKPTEALTRKKLDAVIAKGTPQAAGAVQSAVEDFANEFAKVIRRFLKSRSWRETERIVVGGGFRGSRIGELAIMRAAMLLRTGDAGVEVDLISHDPDEAGLIGAAHLLPAWMLTGYDGILAVDIGGTNIRAGVVELELKAANDLSQAHVAWPGLWRHADEQGLTRDQAVDRLVAMLKELAKNSEKKNVRLAPVVGIGCPGIIASDGTIERGAHNMPGNWHGSRFNLPKRIKEAFPRIGEHDSVIVMHNDAVVQGLSQLPRMREARHWAVLTIGTGLGNARFTNRVD